ncbi:MAG: hypothetical protein ATN35_10130 [Epulopiscium sp. Nele67-Bin004]|nr:MAG: hypothetical protein ATN35_10130 [Epulopiscium sp. Nele67-Bin004]
MSWFSKFFKSRKKDLLSYERNYSKKDIENLFEGLRANFIKLKRQEKYLERAEHLRTSLEKYNELDSKDQHKLKAYASQYKEGVEERQKLNSRLIRNNPSLQKLVPYEAEIPELILELRHVENQIRSCESNIKYLREEKEELIDDREILISGYTFLRKFGIVFLLLLALTFLLLFTMLQVLREDIWIYISLVCAVFIIFMTMILFSKEKLEKEIDKNERLQKKAAKLIKKYQIHYLRHKSYIDYEYKKFGVDSADKLQTYFDRYLKNKVHEMNYNRYVQNMARSERQMAGILKAQKLDFRTIEIIQEWMLVPHKFEEAKSVVRELEHIEKQKQGLVEYEEDLYKQALAYGETEEYKDMVSELLEEYYRWTERYSSKGGEALLHQ